ncbi:hypothetical protein [Vibrio cyclitrophicus]|uniref:hypothetical protein n=1 Tax=Vibrio cyclitrophicus TaxID=47951 RepID=UPI0011B42EE9|nr:hypothetical protein [Vibrio cyclitrophicus]
MSVWKVISFFALFIGFSAKAVLPTGVAMGVVLNDLENTATNIINNGQNAANNVVNNGAFNAISTVEQMKVVYEGVLDKTAEQLTEQQRKAFEGVHNQLEQLFEDIESRQDQVDDTLDNLAVYLSDTVFLSDEPRISRFMSNVAVHGGKNNTDILVEFRGKNLNHKKNKLIVSLDNDKEIEPTVTADSRLAFTLRHEEISQVASNTQLTLIPVEVHIYEDAFIFFSKKKSYKYVVRIVPNDIAQAVIRYKEKEIVVADRKTKSVSGANGSLRSGRTSRRCTNVSLNAYPDSGYKIDQATISYRWHGTDHCSGGNTSCSMNPSGSVATAGCNICTERGTGSRRTCGYSVEVNFTQYKEEEKVHSISSEPLQVSYESAVAWDIPKGGKFDRLELTMFDGRVVILEQEDANEWIDFSLDQSSGTVVISNNLQLEILN